MKTLVPLAAAAALLLSACATSTETMAERPTVKCDVVEATTGSRIARKENCVPNAEATRRQ